MLDPATLVPLGVVVRAHGIQGQVRVHLFNSESTTLLETKRVRVRLNGVVTEHRVRAARPVPDALLVALEGVTTREGADALRGAELCVARADFPRAAPGEHYHVDLVGLSVRTPDGAVVGDVVRVQDYPTVACLVVSGPDGEREVPCVAPYIVSIDEAAGIVLVDGIEDLEMLRPSGERR